MDASRISADAKPEFDANKVRLQRLILQTITTGSICIHRALDWLWIRNPFVAEGLGNCLVAFGYGWMAGLTSGIARLRKRTITRCQSKEAEHNS